MRALSLAIVGVDYANAKGPARRFELAICKPGEPVDLRLEPRNPADPNAVAVYSCRDVQLGYLTAERAPWIGAQIRQGREWQALFQGYTAAAGWLRLAFDGGVPTLPAPATKDEQGVDDSGFWPDEVYPDE